MAAAMLRRVRNTAIKTAAAGTILVGTVEVTTHLPSEGRSSRFYHSLCDDMVTPMMRRILDPETAHHSALEFARRGWAPTFRPSSAECLIEASTEPLGGGLVFGNCIGLAAGFDKDGDAIQPLLEMGFGFVEIGSVTPEPQPGNPKPRMFRLTEDLGVINRYGFNSMGADAVERHLKEYRTGPPVLEERESNAALQTLNRLVKACVSLIRPAAHEQVSGVVGVNLGKNKNSEDEIAVSNLFLGSLLLISNSCDKILKSRFCLALIFHNRITREAFVSWDHLRIILSLMYRVQTPLDFEICSNPILSNACSRLRFVYGTSCHCGIVATNPLFHRS